MVMVGVQAEEVEELLARIVSVVDAGSHVLTQSVPLLEEVSNLAGLMHYRGQVTFSSHSWLL